MKLPTTMHDLQPKHIKLKADETKHLLEKYNISLTQIPKIKSSDAGLPQGCMAGDVIKVERSFREKSFVYYRVVA